MMILSLVAHAQIIVHRAELKPKYLLEAFVDRVNRDGSIRLIRMDLNTRVYVLFNFAHIRLAAPPDLRASAIAILDTECALHQANILIWTVKGTSITGDLLCGTRDHQMIEVVLVSSGLAVPMGKQGMRDYGAILAKAKAQHLGIWAHGPTKAITGLQPLLGSRRQKLKTPAPRWQKGLP